METWIWGILSDDTKIVPASKIVYDNHFEGFDLAKVSKKL